MTKHFCDRCGKDCNNKYAFFAKYESSTEFQKSNKLFGLATIQDFELCENCIEDLINWRRNYNECNTETKKIK